MADPEMRADRDTVRRDLTLMTRRWGELPKPAKLELRSFDGRSKPHWAQFTPARIEEAVDWAVAENAAGRNVYAVRNPIRMDQSGSASDADIMAAFFCWADCDDSVATGNVRRFSGPKWTAAVTTGRVPDARVHLYFELAEPVYNLAAWRGLQTAIAAHLQSDSTVVNPSRIMRVGGTITYPDPRKAARGYISEQCTLRTEYEDDREPIEFERLLRVFPPVERERPKDGIHIDTGTFEGRTIEEYLDLLRQAQTDGEKHSGVRGISAVMAGAGVPERFTEAFIRHVCPVWDANVERLIASAYAKYYRPRGEDPFAHEKAEQKAAPEGEEAAEDGATDDAAKTQRDLSPVDIWGVFPAPKLPRGLLPKVIEDFAFIQGEQMGADPGGLAAAALCVCCAAIPDDVKLRVKRYEEWHESARIWVALVGDPSTKKSPMLSAAERPLRAIDANLYRDFIRRKADYDALKKDEKAEAEKPRQTRKRLEDTTIEAAQEVMADSPDGLLVVQDELSGWFGGMDRYSNGKGKDRSFWLQAFNGGVYAYNRVGRGAGMINNLSACVLGGIQPEPIRGIVADAHDDGLIQRLFPIVLSPAKLGSEDAPPTDAAAAYGEIIAALTRVEVDRPAGFIDVGHRARLIFTEGAQRIRRELEEKHLALMAVECVSRKLAAHIGKYDGLFARLCVAFHAVEHARGGLLPTMVTEDTASRAAAFLHRFLLPHALAFYNGVLDLSDDHDRLTAVAGYILAHRLEVVSARDVARGDRTMRGMTKPDVLRIFEQLEAFGWVTPQASLPRSNAPLTWTVNAQVHELYAERGAAEAKRRAAARQTIKEAAE